MSNCNFKFVEFGRWRTKATLKFEWSRAPVYKYYGGWWEPSACLSVCIFPGRLAVLGATVNTENGWRREVYSGKDNLACQLAPLANQLTSIDHAHLTRCSDYRALRLKLRFMKVVLTSLSTAAAENRISGEAFIFMFRTYPILKLWEVVCLRQLMTAWHTVLVRCGRIRTPSHQDIAFGD